MDKGQPRRACSQSHISGSIHKAACKTSRHVTLQAPHRIASVFEDEEDIAVRRGDRVAMMSPMQWQKGFPADGGDRLGGREGGRAEHG